MPVGMVTLMPLVALTAFLEGSRVAADGKLEFVAFATADVAFALTMLGILACKRSEELDGHGFTSSSAMGVFSL